LSLGYFGPGIFNIVILFFIVKSTFQKRINNMEKEFFLEKGKITKKE